MVDGGVKNPATASDSAPPQDSSSYSSYHHRYHYSSSSHLIVEDEKDKAKQNDDREHDHLFSYYEPDKLSLDAFDRRLSEMNRIRVSLLNELRGLEEKRANLRTELEALTVQSERLQSELRVGVKDLERIRASVEQANVIRRELAERNTPEIALPKALLFQQSYSNSDDDFNISNSNSNGAADQHCSMATCFDYSRCSITSGFPIYVYNDHHRGGNDEGENIFDPSLVRLFSESVYALKKNEDPSKACLFVVAFRRDLRRFPAAGDQQSINRYLPYWGGGGVNHVIINNHNHHGFLGGRSLTISDDNRDQEGASFRFGFDLLIPSFENTMMEEEIEETTMILPIRRHYLLSILPPFCSDDRSSLSGNWTSDQLRKISATKTSDRIYYIDEDCGGTKKEDRENEIGILSRSTFTLILIISGGRRNRTSLSTADSIIIRRFTSALKFGSIPVILSDSPKPINYFLPLAEHLDWRLSTVQLPLARLSELHFYLRTYSDSDIAALRLNGRRFYRTYFSTKRRLVESILAALRHRLNLPPAPADEESNFPVWRINRNESSSLLKAGEPAKIGGGDPSSIISTTNTGDSSADEYLGPIEAPNPSPRFQQNFSLLTVYGYEMWNLYADPFRLYPQMPFTKTALPSEAKFAGSPYGFRPINEGAGGSGKEFSESLGGNFPREQFTVVLLTYEREQVLIAALTRLNNLPYLNKVIVVWNGPTQPNPDTVWPKIQAPIVLVNPKQNSLNNRFLPFGEIETEAVLSIDDDVHLRRDEIIFGFRVWREARDRIVGFPARYHAWNSNSKDWSYNSNHSCELSMVLTGAAFIHKYYFYVYSYSMPAVIRRKVDELMNCEDIAMNFLVSHMTKKPPLKVTSRWTFRCPGCPETLSADETHFLERHDCLNYFSRVYGYNPLLYTQFRVDSILFKMRIPQNHQKCFKFI